MINSFLFGPGGELWFCQGLHIRSRVETPWGVSRLEQAGIWRLWPQRLKLEGFYGSEHEPQNPWGFVFTEWNEPITLAGNNSSAIYPVPGLMVNHRDDAPPLIWKNGNGRKVSGGDIVGTSHFPDSMQGDLILGGYINNAVWRLKISDDGSGFMLEDLPPLIKSSSRSFRPVDAKFGPDGALYLCDWYNPIIGHYQASFRDPGRDKTHGRIWRVTAKGRPLTKPPRLDGATIDELLESLRSHDRWTRRFAKRVLADRPAEAVVAALDQWTARLGLSDHDLVEAMGVYESHESVAAALPARLVAAKEPGARAYAAGVVGVWADRLPDPLALLRPLVADENARVRLQAVVACAQIPRAEALETALIATDFPVDRFLAYAVNQAVYALKPQWLPALKGGSLTLGNKPSRLGWLVQADGTVDALRAARDLLQSSRLDAASREAYLRLLADKGDAADLAMIVQLTDAPLQARLLPELETAVVARGTRPTGDLAAATRGWLASGNDDLRAGALRLAGVWKLEEFRPAAVTAASGAAESERVRRAGVAALGTFGGDAGRTELANLGASGSAYIRGAAIAALCPLDTPAAARLAADVLASLSTADESVATEIFSAFLERKAAAAGLVSALGAKPPSKAAAVAGLGLMSSSGRREEPLVRILSAAAGATGDAKKLALADVPALASEVRASGDATRGKEIFWRPQLGCAACHAINGQGGDIGPNLGSLGTAQPVEFIIGAILEPQKEIKEGYMSTFVATKDGEEYQGYIVRETADELVLRDVLQKKVVRLPRATIQERRQAGSVMPSGLADALTRSEFRDLVRFLSEQGRVR
jgi:putative heme-binding domain-containing protein